jgi:hypothetical protein
MRHNTARGDQGADVHPAFEPMRTLTTTGHQSLITPGDVAAAEALVDDCLFRMLEPHEVAAGMAFPGDYIWAGKRRDRVRLMGNAVTPPSRPRPHARRRRVPRRCRMTEPRPAASHLHGGAGVSTLDHRCRGDGCNVCDERIAAYEARQRGRDDEPPDRWSRDPDWNYPRNYGGFQ